MPSIFGVHPVDTIWWGQSLQHYKPTMQSTAFIGIAMKALHLLESWLNISGRILSISSILSRGNLVRSGEVWWGPAQFNFDLGVKFLVVELEASTQNWPSDLNISHFSLKWKRFPTLLRTLLISPMPMHWWGRSCSPGWWWTRRTLRKKLYWSKFILMCFKDRIKQKDF